MVFVNIEAKSPVLVQAVPLSQVRVTYEPNLGVHSFKRSRAEYTSPEDLHLSFLYPNRGQAYQQVGVKIFGRGFSPTSEVVWEGQAVVKSFVSETEIWCFSPEISANREVPVCIQDIGHRSNTLYFHTFSEESLQLGQIDFSWISQLGRFFQDVRLETTYSGLLNQIQRLHQTLQTKKVSQPILEEIREAQTLLPPVQQSPRNGASTTPRVNNLITPPEQNWQVAKVLAELSDKNRVSINNLKS